MIYKKISKYVLLLLLFLLCIHQFLVNKVQFSWQKHQIVPTFIELNVVFSVIVNIFYVSQHFIFYFYFYVCEVWFTMWQLSQSHLHFFETKMYVQFSKQINIIYVIKNIEKIENKLVISISQCNSINLEKTRLIGILP